MSPRIRLPKRAVRCTPNPSAQSRQRNNLASAVHEAATQGSNSAKTVTINATNQRHQFLIRAAELLHRHGAPSYRLEGVMAKVAQTLDVPNVILYTPTALHLCLGEPGKERTYLRQVESSGVDISKLLAFDSILERLESGEIGVAAARQEFEEAATAPPPYGEFATLSASAVACAGIATIFGGGALDVALSGLFGIAIFCSR